MRLIIVVLLALLAAILVPLIAHSEGLSWSGTCDTRWPEGSGRLVLERPGDEITSAYPTCGCRVPVVTGQTHHARAGSPTT